jgi:hypothetical protein
MVMVSWERAQARRLERSSLVGRTAGTPLARLAGMVCGLHAQVQTSAEQQLAARIDGLQQRDVRTALWETRELAKAWTVRGTLHLHPSDELSLWLAARRAVARRGGDGALPEWRDPAGTVHPPLEARAVEAVRAAVWDALDGRCLRRDQLADAVVARVGAAPSERLRSGFAFFLADLCQGPPEGSRITLARPDQWLRGWRGVDEEQALTEVCRRYVRAYGPAGAQEFREWFGGGSLSAAECRAVFTRLSGELEEVSVDGRPAFVLSGDADFPEPARTVRLLPEYDVLIMGCRERDRLIPEPVRALIAADGRGRYEGPAGVRLVLVDGVAAGLWRRATRGKVVEIDATLAAPARRIGRRALAGEAERIGTLLGVDVALSIRR